MSDPPSKMEKVGNRIVFGEVFYFLNLPLKILIFPTVDNQEIWAWEQGFELVK